jgi:hypothetical protein
MSAREYIVTFGRAGHLGRFRAGAAFTRGAAVVIRGRRGLELGEVLGESAPLPDEYVGELLRAAGDDDRAAAARAADDARALCASAEALAAELALPLTVLDAELMLDGRSAVLHGLTHAACDAGPLLERLGEPAGLIVRYYDLAAEPPRPADAPDAEDKLTCDKPDCGEGQCNDRGDGCSSCSAGAAHDLAAYFAQLRERMGRPAGVALA